MIYNSFILPHFTYCLEIWGNTYQTLLDPIFRLQKKFVRLITFTDFNAHSEPLFNQLNVLNIFQLSKFSSCIFVYDLRNNRYPHNIEKYFDRPIHTYQNRSASSGNFRPPSIKLTITQHNFKYAATKHWNSLPSHLKINMSRQQFKNELRNYILNSTHQP